MLEENYRRMKLTEDVKLLIRRVYSCFKRERKRRRPEIAYEQVQKRVANCLKLSKSIICKVVGEVRSGRP